jgi:hypothetical protein
MNQYFFMQPFASLMSNSLHLWYLSHSMAWDIYDLVTARPINKLACKNQTGWFCQDRIQKNEKRAEIPGGNSLSFEKYYSLLQ